MAPTIRGQTETRWIEEASEGAGVPNSGTLRLWADVVLDAGPRVRVERNRERDIGTNQDVTAVIASIIEHGYRVKFRWQDDANIWALLQDLLAAESNGRLKTYAIEHADAVDAATKAYYTLINCKPDNVDLEVDKGGVAAWVVDFRVGDCTVGTSQPVLGGTTTRQSVAYGTGYFTYVGMGLESPAGGAMAYSAGNYGFGVKHNLDPIPDVGRTTFKSFAEGDREVEFRGEISVDDGGKALYDAVKDGTQADIVIKSSSTAGKPKITLKNCDLPEVDLSSFGGTGHRTTSITKPATTITFGVV